MTAHSADTPVAVLDGGPEEPGEPAGPAVVAPATGSGRAGHSKAVRVVVVCVVVAVGIGAGIAIGRNTASPSTAAPSSAHKSAPLAAAGPHPAMAGHVSRAIDPDTIIPDPTILVGKTVDYLYAGENGFTPPHIPVRTYRVFGQWLQTVDAMPTLPAWAGEWVWNPDVREVGSHYVLWYSAFDNDAPKLPATGAAPRCLGWATASSPLGPFVPSATPAVCQTSLYGDIDPRTFMASDGQEWLYWKSDGNAVRAFPLPTTIFAQRLAPNGITLEGSPVDLITNSQPWEGAVVESPQMVESHGDYYLFFSGNVSGSPQNGIGVAPCVGPGGPCSNTSARPWLDATVADLAVGEESLFTQDGSTWLMYSPRGLAQTLALARIGFNPTGPYDAAFTTLPGVPAPEARRLAQSASGR